MITVVFKAELLQLKRSITLLIMLLAYGVLGCYAIFYGQQTVNAQQMKITGARDSIAGAQAAYVSLLREDTTNETGRYNFEKAALPSLVRFNYAFLAFNPPQPMAALCIGQRDLFPLYYTLNGQSYYIQTLKGDIYNPFKLSTGNFDLSFVIIYLLPLMIGGFCFDLFPVEWQTGTGKLITVASGSFGGVLLLRLIFRTLLLLSITLLLSFAGFLVAGATSLTAMLAWCSVVMVYVAFWAGLLLWINSFRKDASFNAISFLISWLLIIIVIPTGINLFFSQQPKPHQLQLASLMRSRNMPEVDSAMLKALHEFYRYQPQYRPKDSVRSGDLMSKGYSAFLYNGDLRADLLTTSAIGRQKLQEQQFAWFNIVNPAYNTSELFSVLAGSTQADERNFERQVRDFHHAIFHFTAQPLFAEQRMTANNYLKQPHFHPATITSVTLHWAINFALLIAGATSLWLMGWRRIDCIK